ncbi:hypothetical protein GCM10025771_10390 [Niveibacterium umoris]|uniref:Putative nucleotidyltransferase n=1 Tax=Niveibacterium umoris TaxID=1193620 RepID=A0A840BKB3_9RHOO|nr:nucleotidyltransferase domain-containing protein [Niveibacterium umoris]MBB4013410.1 putative nucleotidyltransferase [Niveibacterium umoris]
MIRFAHHQHTVNNVLQHFAGHQSVEAVLLAGSIAHGYARAESDVDVLILVTAEEFARRQAECALTLYDPALATYAGGYVDGKFIHRGFIEQVARSGSDAARYAFKDARVLWSRIDDLEQLVADASRYPVADKAERLARFFAQLEAWHWYAQEALRVDNAYLLTVACAKLALFGARLVLAENEWLFPFHKWLLRELAAVPEQPAGLVEALDDLMRRPDAQRIECFYTLVRGFRPWPEGPAPWPMRFMRDSELNWMGGTPPVDDL